MRCCICGKTVDMGRDGRQVYAGERDPSDTMYMRVAHKSCLDKKETIRIGGLARAMEHAPNADRRRTERVPEPAPRRRTEKKDKKPKKQVYVSKKDLDRHSRGISQIFPEFTNRRRR